MTVLYLESCNLLNLKMLFMLHRQKVICVIFFAFVKHPVDTVESIYSTSVSKYGDQFLYSCSCWTL